MQRVISLTAAAMFVVGAVVSAVVGAAPAGAAPVEPAQAGSYEGLVTPVRALDTRTANGGGALVGNESRVLSLADQVSSTATAAVLNVTVAAPTTGGYVTVYPADAAVRPTASSLNFRPGEIRSNNVTVALPTGTGAPEAVRLYNFSGSTQVVVDVLGYYDPAATGDGGDLYTPEATPFRALDTRTAGGPVAAGAGVQVPVPAPAAGDPTDVEAVAVNITAAGPSGPGYLTAYNGDPTTPKPFVSTVNYGTDPATPNFSIVPVLHAGNGALSFRVANSVSRSDVIVDVVGYYSRDLGTGSLYAPVAPVRIADTRSSNAPAVGANTTRNFSTPPFQDTTALNLNVTAVDATGTTYLTVFPQGTAKPGVSSLNVFSPAALANAVQTAVTPQDASPAAVGYSVYNLSGTVDVVVDLQGYFVPLD